MIKSKINSIFERKEEKYLICKIKSKKMIIMLAVFLLLGLVIFFTWYMSSKSGDASDVESIRISNIIEKIIELECPIEKRDVFWHGTLDHIVRKVAHFIIYIIEGSIVSFLLNLIIRKRWTSSLTALIMCIALASVDEYHQSFVPGRTMRLFDLTVDTVGAFIGIISVTILFSIVMYIRNLKQSVHELECRN